MKFIYSGRDVACEEDEDNSVRYIRGNGRLVASDSENARTYYHYVCDGLGSVSHVLLGNEYDCGCAGEDVSSRILCKYEYDGFGNRVSMQEDVLNRYGFAGEMRDDVMGQYYLRARYYVPEIGRFTQADTYHGDGLNLYVYARNNPVRYVDPDGHESKEGVESSSIKPDNSQFPQTRLDIHNDLISKGYHTTGTTDKGYVVYKDGNGHIVTIKPSGEVIPTVRMPVDPNNTLPKAKMYNQRTYYDGTIIPDELNDHTTGYNVGKICINDFYPEPYKWEGNATWMEEN